MVYLSNEIKAAAMRSRGTRFVSSMSSILCIVNMMNVLKLVKLIIDLKFMFLLNISFVHVPC